MNKALNFHGRNAVTLLIIVGMVAYVITAGVRGGRQGSVGSLNNCRGKPFIGNTFS